MMRPAAKIHWFFLKKGCDEDDVTKMLQKCFSPDEVAKINRVFYNGPLAVLKEAFHLDMSIPPGYDRCCEELATIRYG